MGSTVVTGWTEEEVQKFAASGGETEHTPSDYRNIPGPHADPNAVAEGTEERLSERKVEKADLGSRSQAAPEDENDVTPAPSVDHRNIPSAKKLKRGRH